MPITLRNDRILVEDENVSNILTAIVSTIVDNPTIVEIQFTQCEVYDNTFFGAKSNGRPYYGLFGDICMALRDNLARGGRPCIYFVQCQLNYGFSLPEQEEPNKQVGAWVEFDKCYFVNDFVLDCHMSASVEMKGCTFNRAFDHIEFRIHRDFVLDAHHMEKACFFFTGIGESPVLRANVFDVKDASVFFSNIFHGKLDIGTNSRRVNVENMSLSKSDVKIAASSCIIDSLAVNSGSTLHLGLKKSYVIDYRITESRHFFDTNTSTGGAGFLQGGFGRVLASGVTMYISPSEWLNHHLEYGEYKGQMGYFAYKVFGKSFAAPSYWKVEDGQVIRENVAMSHFEECATGINLAPIDWKFGNGKMHKLFIPVRYLADVEITQPRLFAEPEKFRVGYAVIVGVVIDVIAERNRVHGVLLNQRSASPMCQVAPDFQQRDTYLVNIQDQSSVADIFGKSNWGVDPLLPSQEDYSYVVEDVERGLVEAVDFFSLAVKRAFEIIQDYGDMLIMEAYTEAEVDRQWVEINDEHDMKLSIYYTKEAADFTDTYEVIIYAIKKEDYAHE